MINSNLLGTTNRASRQYSLWIFPGKYSLFPKPTPLVIWFLVRFLVFGGVWRLRSLLQLDHRHYHYRYRRHHRLFAIKKVFINYNNSNRAGRPLEKPLPL